MITFSLLVILALVITIGILFTLFIGGIGIVSIGLAFGDIIVCLVLLVLILKAIFGKKKN